MIRTRVAVVLAAAAAGLIALVACDDPRYGKPRRDTDPDQDVATKPPPAPDVSLAVADVGELGPVVTDQDGRTLYRFDKDKAAPSVSNCGGECARQWPPVLVGDAADVRLDGVDQRVVGAVVRADGGRQLTLNGWPQYRHAGDTKPGDAGGHGVSGMWFASRPDGKKAVAAWTAPASDPSDGY